MFRLSIRRAGCALTSAALWLFPLIAKTQFAPPMALLLPEIGGVASCSAGDLDGDGDADLIAASNRGIHLLTNSGASTFTDPQPIYLVEMRAPYATLVDYDDDGNLDILFYMLLQSTSETGVYLLRGNGNGSFDSPEFLVSLSSAVVHIELIDLDDDGDDDLVVGHTELGALWYPSDGSGIDFSNPDTVSSTPMDTRPILCDATGDGLTDILIASSSLNRVVLARNQGSGEFVDTQMIGPVNWNTIWFVAYDIDNDTDVDIVMDGSANDARVYQNSGSGAFTLLQTFSGELGPGFAPIDLNADGFLDLAAGNGYSGDFLHITYNQGDGTLGAGQNVPDSYHSGSVFPLAVDFSGDGLQDIVTYAPETNRISSFLANGDGTLGPQQFLTAPFGSIRETYSIDLNADDLDDIVACTSNPDCVYYALNDGQGAWPIAVRLDSVVELSGLSAWYSRCTFGDVDGDGDVDLIRCDPYFARLYLNDGAGGFSSPLTIASNLKSLRLGDIDGDSDPDIVATQTSAPTLFSRLNNGSGIFGSPQQIGIIGGFYPIGGHLELVDVNGDGALDIAATSAGCSSTHLLRWYRNLGGGSFDPEFIDIYSPNDDFQSIDFSDMDGDQDLDALFAIQGSGTVLWRRNNGSGSFSSTPSTSIPPSTSYLKCARACDVDGDGDKDVVWAQIYPGSYSPTSSLVRWQRNTSGVFDYGGPICSGPFTIHDLKVVDMDGNTRDDIIASSLFQSASLLMKNFHNSPFRIEGAVFWDQNANAVLDSGEVGFPATSVACDPLVILPIASAEGQYAIPLAPGQYTVSPALDPSLWVLTTSPESYEVELTQAAPLATGIDFGFVAAVDTTILNSGIVAPTGPCSGMVVQSLYAQNTGTTHASGVVHYTLDSSLVFVSATPSPDSISGFNLYWHLDSLPPFATSNFSLLVTMPDATLIGELLQGTLSISSFDGDPISEPTTWSGVLECSYDPNDKSVTPAGDGLNGIIPLQTEELVWTVRFQNTGTAPAVDVAIVDPLPTEVDFASVTILSSSHAITESFVESDGDLVVRFLGIQLPDSATDFLASCGYVRFRAALNAGLPNGTYVNNTAGIYFDLNPPVITNTTVNQLLDCSDWLPTLSFLSTGQIEASNGIYYEWYVDGQRILSEASQHLSFISSGEYYAIVTNALGCAQQTNSLFLFTSIPSLEPGGFSLQPNPATESVQLTSSFPIHREEVVEVFDAIGQLVHTSPGSGSHRVEIPLEHLSPGLYVVRLASSGPYVLALPLVVE